MILKALLNAKDTALWMGIALINSRQPFVDFQKLGLNKPYDN